MLLLKMVLSPTLIGVASWVSQRWGAAAGGWFAALPLTSGPVMFVIALERGPAFAAQASLGALMALVSLAAFVLVYSWLALSSPSASQSRSLALPLSLARSLSPARRFSLARPWSWSASWPCCSFAGCAAYLVCTWALRDVSMSLPLAFAIVCIALLVTLRAMPADAARETSTSTSAAAPAAVWWDIPLRMMLAAALVFTLTRIAGTLGPRLSGLLTPFPIAVTILAAFTHHFDGAAVASQLLRGLVRGLFSFAIFFLVTGLAVTRWSVAVTFVAATISALAWHAVVGTWKGDVRAAVVHRRRVARGI